VVVEIRSGRGSYRLTAMAALETDDAASTLTLTLERADGIERIALRCRVARELIDLPPPGDQLVVQIAPWIERNFEQVREAALKSIRAERRLFELAFDRGNPGPF
jgi:hypothetical protein